jgi:hypothetical protein
MKEILDASTCGPEHIKIILAWSPFFVKEILDASICGPRRMTALPDNLVLTDQKFWYVVFISSHFLMENISRSTDQMMLRILDM